MMKFVRDEQKPEGAFTSVFADVWMRVV